MDSEIKNKLNKKYNLSEKDIEIISIRVDELNKAIKEPSTAAATRRLQEKR